MALGGMENQGENGKVTEDCRLNFEP